MKTIGTLLVGAAFAALASGASAQTTLVGAVQFDEDHAFTKSLREFERLAGECSGGSLVFDLHLNSELGLEKDYFENMSQGIAVDYAHRLAQPHVHLQPAGTADGHAVPVPRP